MEKQVLLLLAQAYLGDFAESGEHDPAAIDEAVLNRWLDRTFDTPPVLRLTPWGREKLAAARLEVPNGV